MQGLVVQTLSARPDYPFSVYPQTIYGQYTDLLREPSGVMPGYIGTHSPEGYFSHYRELNEIGRKCGTDKSDQVHNYLNKYEFFLHPWKDKSFTMLELGVFDGESVRMWRDYFQHAKIVGVDIDERCLGEQGERIEIVIGDLSLEETLDSLKPYAPDIIIDDASHIWSHQIKSLYTLFPVLPHGGIFILEDLETSFPIFRYGNFDDSVISAYDFCSAVAKVVTGGEYLPELQCSPSLSLLKPEVEAIASQIEMISFIKGSCILVKK